MALEFCQYKSPLAPVLSVPYVMAREELTNDVELEICYDKSHFIPFSSALALELTKMVERESIKNKLEN